MSLNYFILSQDSIQNNLVNSADTNQQQQQSLTIAQKILSHKDQIKAFRVLACKELRGKICQNDDVERVERLLLRISSLKKMSTTLMEELFFNDAIGNVQIEGLIPSIIGSNADESQEVWNLDEVIPANQSLLKKLLIKNCIVHIYIKKNRWFFIFVQIMLNLKNKYEFLVYTQRYKEASRILFCFFFVFNFAYCFIFDTCFNYQCLSFFPCITFWYINILSTL